MTSVTCASREEDNGQLAAAENSPGGAMKTVVRAAHACSVVVGLRLLEKRGSEAKRPNVDQPQERT